MDKKELKNISIIIALAIIIRLVSMFLNTSLTLFNFIITACVLVNIFIVYKIARLIVKKNKIAALLPAMILAVIPLWPDIAIQNNTSQLLLSISSIFFMLSLYTLLNLKIFRIGIFFPIIATILHPSATLLIPAFIGYFILAILEHNKIQKKEIIYATLSIIFIILISFFSINISALSLQLPVFAELKHVVGLIPLYLGFVGAYFGLKNNNKRSLLLTSAGGSGLIFLFFKIIVAESLVLYIGMCFAVLSCLMLKEIQGLIKISRVKKHSNKIISYIFIAVLLSSIFLWV